MDGTVPYYEPMGIQITDKRRFIAVLREILIWARREYAVRPLTDEYSEHAVREISGQLGEKTGLSFLNWVIHIFETAPADYPHTNAWFFILTWCAGNRLRWGRLGLPVSKSRSLLVEFKKATNDQDIYANHEEQVLDPVSDWDAVMYSNGEFDNDFMDPFNWIVNTINMNRFRSALNNLIGQLSAPEVEAFWSSVQRIGLENGLTKISNLAKPSDLNETAKQ